MPCKFPCTVCKFNVHNNHRAIFCDSCHNWTHLKCTPFTSLEYILCLSGMTTGTVQHFLPVFLHNYNHFDNDIDFFFALYDFNLQGNFDAELLKQKKFIPFLITLRRLIC